TATLDVEAPVVIRLARQVRRPPSRPALTRRAVFLRDNYTCQYCGLHSRDLTLDHVVPRHRGGRDAWDNLVAACRACNHRKGHQAAAKAESPRAARAAAITWSKAARSGGSRTVPCATSRASAAPARRAAGAGWPRPRATPAAIARPSATIWRLFNSSPRRRLA